ncbi:MAG TPA: AMIN domain-containing protein, partial [Stenomitos sp.]
MALALAHPAWAAPSQVGSVRYEEARHALTIETSGAPVVQTKRLLNPDRLVIDLLDAELSGLANREAAVPSRKIRGFRAVQYSLTPSVVRLIVELKPGVDPLVEVRQVSGRITVTLADSPLPTGEKDLETLPPS